MTSTADIIAGFYNLAGITTESVLYPLVIGQVPLKVALNNPNRVSSLFINTSDDDIYLAFDPAPSDTNGILLVANGGSFGLEITSDFGLTGYAMYAVSTGATSSLQFLETQINN